MKKLKLWLYDKFLPAWCREDLLDANRRLTEALLEERQKNRELEAYLGGLREAMRRSPRVTICGTEVKK